MHPLVREQIRQNSQQAFLNVVSLSLAVMMMLTIAEATADAISDPNRFTDAVRIMITGMAWLGTGAAVVFMAINRHSQVRERTRQFAILRVLGGSLSFIARLLWQETMLIAVPGTMAGIVLAYVHKLLIGAALRGLFVLHNPYSFWLPAGAIATSCFFSAGLFAAWMATRLDVIDALACED